MTIRIKVLPVYQGDAISLSFDDINKYIMIDGGPKRSYSKGVLAKEIQKINRVDLLILTHTDEDHIGGVLKYYEDENRLRNVFKNVWFNTGILVRQEFGVDVDYRHQISISNMADLEISIKQGNTLESKLIEENILHNSVIKAGDFYDFDYCKMKILSPEIVDLKAFYSDWIPEDEKTLLISSSNEYGKGISDLLKIAFREHGTLANKTSLAFLVERNDSRLLLMGDAFPSIIENNIRKLGYNERNKLKLDITKVSHHGSTSGISPNLLNIIDCNKFIISTNGSNGLPSKECLARIISHRNDKIVLYFNYENEITKSIFSTSELNEYNFEVKYLNEEMNYTITI